MFKQLIKYFFLFIIFAKSTVSFALPIPKKIYLSDALEIAIQNYPSVKARMAEIDAASFEAAARNLNYTLPTVSFQAQGLFATSNQIRGTFYPNEGTAIPTSGGIKVNGYTSDAVFSSFSTLLVSYKVANFGKKKAEEQFSAASIEQAKFQASRELYEHKVKVTDAYLLTVVFEEAIKIQQKNLERTEAFYQAIFANTSAGLRPGVDSSLAAAEVSKAKLLLFESQRIAKQQKNKLAELLGGINSDFELASDQFNTSYPESTGSVDKQLSLTHPILQYFQKRMDFSIAKTLVIQKSYLPTIYARGAGWARGSGITDRTDPDGNFVYNSSLTGLGFRAYDYMIGFTTLWNISDVFRTKQETKAQQSITKIYQANFNEVELQLKGQEENADLQYKTSIEIAHQTPIQLKAAQEAYNQATARYQSGLSNIIELTQATNILNRAEIDQVVANNNVWRAVFLKSASKGDLATFLQQIK